MKTKFQISLSELQSSIDIHELCIELLWAMRRTVRLIELAKSNMAMYEKAGFYDLLKKAEHEHDIQQRVLVRLGERYLKAMKNITG